MSSERLFIFLRLISMFGPTVMSRALSRRLIVRTIRTWPLSCLVDFGLGKFEKWLVDWLLTAPLKVLCSITKGLFLPEKSFGGGIIESKVPRLEVSSDESPKSLTRSMPLGRTGRPRFRVSMRPKEPFPLGFCDDDDDVVFSYWSRSRSEESRPLGERDCVADDVDGGVGGM